MCGPSDTVRVDVWRHPGKGGGHVVAMPADVADEVRAVTAGAGRPFGMVPVRARVGDTAWASSLFADRASSSYLPALNGDVRRREGITEGDRIRLIVQL